MKKTIETPQHAESHRLGVRTFGYALSAIALCGLTCTPMATALADDNVKAAEGPDSAGTSDVADASYVTGGTAASTPTKDATIGNVEKDETVYVFCDAAGHKRDLSVSNTLKNRDGLDYIIDGSSLADIKNSSSIQTFTQNGTSILWDAQGKDVFYSGSSKDKLPVTFSAKYYLDGKRVEPEQLAGASGQVKIAYTFKNHSRVTEVVDGAASTVYTPFLAASVFAFDSKVAHNISVDNGKVVTAGDRSVVVGYALPGMQDNLGISAVDFAVPDSFSISFDATDFHMDGSYTLVTSNLFDDVDVDGIDASSIESSLSELSEAMDQLVDGSSQLADGVAQLEDKTAQMPDGVNRLNDGACQLAAGLPQAKDGAQQIADGADTLGDALDLVRNGSEKQTGLVDAVNSIGEKTDTEATTLQGGINQLRAGVAALKGSQNEENPVQSTGAYAMLAVAQGIAAATSPENTSDSGLFAGTKNAFDGAQTVLSGIGDLNAAADGYVKNALHTLTSASEDLTSLARAASGIAESAQGLASDAQNAGQNIQSAVSTASAAQAAASDAAETASSASDDAASAQTAASNAAGEAQAVVDALNGIDTKGMTEEQISAINEAIGSAASAAADAGTAADAANTAVESMGAAADGISTAATSIGTAQTGLMSAVETIQSAADKAGGIVQGLQGIDVQAITGLGQNVGRDLTIADAILAGDGSITQKPSISMVVSQASQELSTGSQKILDGMSQVNGYASILADGIQGEDGLIAGAQSMDEALQTIQAALDMLRNGGTAPDGRSSAGFVGLLDGLGSSDEEESLIGGAMGLHAGASELGQALGEASEGASVLAGGTQALADSVPQLVDGVSQLRDGAGQLADGAKTFNEEGIQKLVSLFEDNLGGLGNRLKAMKAAGSGYRSFSGAADNSESEVKFIYKTDAIELPSIDGSGAETSATDDSAAQEKDGGEANVDGKTNASE